MPLAAQRVEWEGDGVKFQQFSRTSRQLLEIVVVGSSSMAAARSSGGVAEAARR